MSVKTLLRTLPQTGRVTWIGIRPERRGDVETVEAVTAKPGYGLLGDHKAKRDTPSKSGKRDVTLIQAEHLRTVTALCYADEVDPALLRRNILVSGINLLALKGQRFYVGEVLLEGTGLCHPCSRMEENLGPGGYNAMRGHGGITARIVEGGEIRVGDEVRLEPSPEASPPL